MSLRPRQLKQRPLATSAAWTVAAVGAAYGGDPVTYDEIADAATAIPAGSGNFGYVFDPALHAGEVCFWGRDVNWNQGIYSGIDGGLDVVANTSTAIPGGFGTFAEFGGDPMLHGGQIALVGWGAGGQMGIYTYAPGSGVPLAVLADKNMPVPSGSGNFTFTGWPSLHDGVLHFLGFGVSGQSGIYAVDGPTMRMLVDEGTAIPGGTGSFTAFEGPSNDGDRMAFRGLGASGQRGVYMLDAAGLHRIADRSTSIPEGSGTFTDFGTIPSASDGTIAFLGLGPGGQAGIYLYDDAGGTLSRLVDRSTGIPGGSGSFTSFHNYVSNSAGRVAFVGTGTGGQRGLFVYDPVELVTIIAQGDTIGGVGVQSISSIDRDSFDGDQVVFTVMHTVGGFATYVAAFEDPVPPVPGDVNGDGAIDVNDLVLLILAWGPCGESCPADVDGDGTVGVADLVLVILNWS